MGSGKKHRRSRSRSRSRPRDERVERSERKRRRRSRSPSPTSTSTPTSAPAPAPAPTHNLERRRRHKQKRRRSSDVEEVPVDSHLASPPPPEKRSKHPESERPSSSSKADSLSIEETNRLRAKLGLKPLQVTEEVSRDDGKITDDLGEFYHKPAENINTKKQHEKIRAKLSERKEKRLLEQRLMAAKALGDSDEEEENALLWIEKNRQIIKQKEEAAKRAAILDELDAEFGIGELAEQEIRNDRRDAYNQDSLRGLRVLHDVDAFREEQNVILTLEDREVLAEGDDVLVNVNMKDDDRYKKSNENKKSSSTGYNPYEGADDVELYGVNPVKKVLGKYDEEIFGSKKPDGFVIGDADQEEARKFKKMIIKEKLSTKRVESLVLPDLKIASQYYTEEEIKAKFKKPKKKGKLRKKAKTESANEGDSVEIDGNLVTDDTDIKPEILPPMEMDDEEDDAELELALAKARRLKLAEQQKIPKLEDIVSNVKDEPDEIEHVAGGIVLDSTAEFCRTLGDIPTYGQAGNRDVDAEELLELERSVKAELDEIDKAEGTWNSIDMETEQQIDVTKDGISALAAEPTIGAGLAGALRLALSKGYLEKGREARTAPPALSHLRAHHYSIDDKAHGDDDKFNRRERGYSGPITEFKEKDSFRPNVKLDYVDDDGRPLPPKEAFRYLSHKFHGKGPGKNKQEKRIKQGQQEGLMKKMSSTDTPLGTLALLQARQKESQTPYVVLSGAKQPRTAAP